MDRVHRMLYIFVNPGGGGAAILVHEVLMIRKLLSVSAQRWGMHGDCQNSPYQQAVRGC